MAGAWHDGVFSPPPHVAPALSLIVCGLTVVVLGLFPSLIIWHWRQEQRRAAERRVQERLDREWDPVWWEERQARRAKWNTTSDALAQETAYLAQNWPVGVPLLVQEYGKTAIHTYSGWAGPAREAHVIGGDVLGIPVDAPHRTLALALIRHLQSQEVQKTLVGMLGWPSLRSDTEAAVAAWMQPHVAAIGAYLRLAGPGEVLR